MSENQKGLPIKNDEKGHVMTADNAPMASVRIAGEPDDKNINRYELESARRALRLIKGNLGYNRLHALVSEQIAEGNALFRDHVKRSDGKQATGIITLEATGLTAANFSAWMNRAFAREDVLIAAHPEHYLIMSGPNGPHIVETLGDHVVGFYMGSWDKSEVPAGGTDSIDKRHSLLTFLSFKYSKGEYWGSVEIRVKLGHSDTLFPKRLFLSVLCNIQEQSGTICLIRSSGGSTFIICFLVQS